MLAESSSNKLPISESLATLKIKYVCICGILWAGRSKPTAFVLIGNHVNLV